MAEKSCNVCGLELFTDVEKKRKICVSCWRRGFHTPLLNRRVFIIPQASIGIIRTVDAERLIAMVELVGRKEKSRKKEPFWVNRDWIPLHDLRLWTKERSKLCKSDPKLWQNERMP